MHLKIGKDLELCYRLLVEGNPVAIPTETVYGLAANAFDENAVSKVFDIKNRPKFDPLIVHCATVDDVKSVGKDIPQPLLDLAIKFWPGPLTIVVNKSEEIPDIVTAGKETVAIRIPNHPLTLDLLYGLYFPLAAPSANPFTYVSPTSAFHVLDQLGEKIEYILDGGECEVGLESTIIRMNNDQIEVMRLGGISVEDLQENTDLMVVLLNDKDKESMPGSHKRHYSNNKVIELIPNGGNIPELNDGEAAIAFLKDTDAKHFYHLSETGDINEAARNLFGTLRMLDKPEYQKVYIELAPEKGLGPAINERLRRAAAE
ncbi:MAG: threonylcarbamoyl-AMP synthase [Bacteroidia bacterium]